MAGWYIRRGEKIVGPVDLQKLRELVGNGRVVPTDNLATDISGPWNAAGRTDLFADNVRIKKGILGGHTISYDCPHCSGAIKSPLDDAGKSDTCPQCGRQIIVPCAGQRDRIREEESAAAELKRVSTQLQQQKKQEIAVQQRRQELEFQPAPQLPQIQSQPQELTVSSQSRPCPYCGEAILAVAKKCKHCGEFLDRSLAVGPAPVSIPQPPAFTPAPQPPVVVKNVVNVVNKNSQVSGCGGCLVLIILGIIVLFIMAIATPHH